MHTAVGFWRIASISLRTTRMGAVSASVWKLRASCEVSNPIKSCGVGKHLTVKGIGKGVTEAEPPFMATQYSRRRLFSGASTGSAVVLFAGSAEVFMVDLLVFGNSDLVRMWECLPRVRWGHHVARLLVLFC